LDDWAKFKTNFSSALRQRRKALGLSQQELAKTSGFSRSYIADVERGARSITLKTAWKIANCMNIKLSKLVTQSEQDNSITK